VSEESGSWDNVPVKFTTANGTRYNITKDSVTNDEVGISVTIPNRKIVYVNYDEAATALGGDEDEEKHTVTAKLDGSGLSVLFEVDSSNRFDGNLYPKPGLYPLEFDYKDSGKIKYWIFREKIKSIDIESDDESEDYLADDPESDSEENQPSSSYPASSIPSSKKRKRSNESEDDSGDDEPSKKQKTCGPYNESIFEKPVRDDSPPLPPPPSPSSLPQPSLSPPPLIPLSLPWNNVEVIFDTAASTRFGDPLNYLVGVNTITMKNLNDPTVPLRRYLHLIGYLSEDTPDKNFDSIRHTTRGEMFLVQAAEENRSSSVYVHIDDQTSCLLHRNPDIGMYPMHFLIRDEKIHEYYIAGQIINVCASNV